MTKTKIHDVLMILLIVVCICVATVIGGHFNVSTAYAESDDVQTRYEETNVLNNLKGSTIGGKAFDLKDYPHNSNGKPQIISFVEFCYSYYADKQSDYGLYVYIYNPQDVAIDTNTDRNKIQLTYGNKPSYDKYTLQFLNYSKEVGYEGRFYKFKINLSETQIYNILNTVNSDERVYKISGIELSVKSTVTEYPVISTYKYKGYALGYGSELAESDTLTCTVDGFDKYLTLDVKSTYWRPDGTHKDKITRDTLHSVYFSVPNSIIAEYGEMTAVHATWLNAYTNPITVTGNKTVYNALNKFVGKEMHGGDLCDYKNNGLDYALLAMRSYSGNQSALETNKYSLYHSYNAYETDKDHPAQWGDNPPHQNLYGQVNTLNYLFYAENGDADSYDLPAEQIVGNPSKGISGWLKTYTDKYGTKEVNSRYSRKLFEKWDGAFTDINIRSTDTFNLQDVVFSDNFWEMLFKGKYIDYVNNYEMQAIQKVTLNDINAESSHATFCDKYYIAESDYDEFVSYVTEASAKAETVYLFRYYQSKYRSMEVTTAKRTYVDKTFINMFKSCMFHSDCSFDHGYYEYVDSNAYFAQMWVQLDFDIIDLTFTKDGVATIIPVVMNPIDIAADAEHPVYTSPEIPDGLSWWQILLAILLGILVIILLLKFAPGVLTVIVKILVFIITLPFKLLGAIFKPIHNKAKAVREKRKIARAAKKEQQHIEREQRKERERERKEAEKQKRRDDKIKRKEQERQRKRDEKERERKRKQQDRDFAKWRNKQERQARKNLKRNKKKKLTLADLDKMSDSELAELYYEEYYDEFGEAFPDDDPFDY